MISVILPTIHPGGMDFVVESFGKNPRNWDYELIVVDEYPGRVERGLAKKYLERNGVKVGWYGPAKEKSIPLTLCGWCNAVNTGLIHARGDYVIVMQDYVTLTSDWYIRWELVIADKGRKCLISGTAMEHNAPKTPRYDDILSWPDHPEAWAKRFALPYHPWVPGEFELFYWGFPIEFAEAINGLDERADHRGPSILDSLLIQAKALDYKCEVILPLVCLMINHREWDDPSVDKWPLHPNTPMGLWRNKGELSSTSETIEWVCPSPNKFSLRDLRQHS